MEKILGKEFHIDQVKYRVVDVRNIGGDTMVYAESALDDTPRPNRAAFHLVDVEPFLADQAIDAA